MAFAHVVTSDGVAGTVVIVDRDPDGTVIVLVCAESEGQGLVIPSDDPEDDYVYDLGFKGADKVAVRMQSPEPFVVTFDTSEMPRGPLTFDLGRFVEQARHHADVDQPIRLTEEIAFQFGYRAHASA